MTCCTEQMEVQMRAQSRQEFDKAVKDALSKMATLFKTRANKFDGKVFGPLSYVAFVLDVCRIADCFLCFFRLFQ